MTARVGIAAVLATLTACGGAEAPGTPELANGERLFVERCAGCHDLGTGTGGRAGTGGHAGTGGRAGTGGSAGAGRVGGPDLEAALAPARRGGLGEITIAGAVRRQIALGRPGMPANLVEGGDARDVAAYVARATSGPVPATVTPPRRRAPDRRATAPHP